MPPALLSQDEDYQIRSSLRLRYKKGEFWYPLLHHPLSRILKFEYIVKYFKDLQSGGTVVDYGSGDRPYEELLLTKFSRYVAADYELTNSEHAKRPDIYIRADHVEFPSETANCVIFTEVMEHLYEPRSALREIYRILMPGGRLIGTVPFVVCEHEEPFDYYRYTYYSLERMFKESRFEIIALEYVGDNFSVCLITMNRVLNIVSKAFNRLGLNWISYLLNVTFKIPEFIYMAGRRMGIDPQRISYFRKLPVGFAFCLEKPKRLSDDAVLF